jgi:hypothetical protein
MHAKHPEFDNHIPEFLNQQQYKRMEQMFGLLRKYPELHIPARWSEQDGRALNQAAARIASQSNDSANGQLMRSFGSDRDDGLERSGTLRQAFPQYKHIVHWTISREEAVYMWRIFSLLQLHPSILPPQRFDQAAEDLIRTEIRKRRYSISDADCADVYKAGRAKVQAYLGADGLPSVNPLLSTSPAWTTVNTNPNSLQPHVQDNRQSMYTIEPTTDEIQIFGQDLQSRVPGGNIQMYAKLNSPSGPEFDLFEQDNRLTPQVLATDNDVNPDLQSLDGLQTERAQLPSIGSSSGHPIELG